jgi:hypothetical protein
VPSAGLFAIAIAICDLLSLKSFQIQEAFTAAEGTTNPKAGTTEPKTTAKSSTWQ